MAEFKLVECYSNWCYEDYLDGRELKDGEILESLWPDGTKFNCEVILKKERIVICDMGHDYDTHDHKSFISLKTFGTETLIPLRHSKIKFRRV